MSDVASSLAGTCERNVEMPTKYLSLMSALTQKLSLQTITLKTPCQHLLQTTVSMMNFVQVFL